MGEFTDEFEREHDRKTGTADILVMCECWTKFVEMVVVAVVMAEAIIAWY